MNIDTEMRKIDEVVLEERSEITDVYKRNVLSTTIFSFYFKFVPPTKPYVHTKDDPLLKQWTKVVYKRKPGSIALKSEKLQMCH